MPAKLFFLSVERRGRVEIQRGGRVLPDKSRETLVEHFLLDGVRVEKSQVPPAELAPARATRRRAS